jgi:CubicO group peptidase (beta-lactamase class C family)
VPMKSLPTQIAWTADPAAAAAAGFDPARLALVAQVLRREVEEGRIPGAVVAVLRRGQLALHEAVGAVDPVSRTPMPRDAIFSIASMTKPMTSVAIMQLHEEGRLLLADPVAKFLPELSALRVALPAAGGALVTQSPKNPPTIQDLLRHTSGLTYRDRGTTAAHKLYPGSSITAAVALDRKAFLAAIAQSPLINEPGTVWEYGFSTDILGLVIEAIEQQPLQQVLARRIWSPLGMSDTGFELPTGARTRYAKALPKDPLTGSAQHIHHATDDRAQWDSGGGGAVSTTLDYARFAAMLLAGGTLEGKRILGCKTVELMTSDHLTPDIENRIADTMDPSCAGYGFGLGFAVRRQNGIAAMAGSAGDYYWSGVYGTYFWVDPREEMACVFMAAAPGAMRLRYRQLVRGLVYQAIAD